MSSARTVIFANGVLPDLEKARALLRVDDTMICADGGTRHALALGLSPSIVVGDLDSLSEADRRWIAAAGTKILQYQSDKDETDLELALRYAEQQPPATILIMAALGGRIDQTLANISLLASSGLSTHDCRLDDGLDELFFCRDHAEVHGTRGDVVSLMPWGAPATGVHAQGFRWPLRGETLYPERTRAISNEMLADSADVRVESGLLLIMHRRRS